MQTDTDVSTQEKTDPETSVNTEQPIQTEEAESTTPVEDINSKSEENVSQNNNINTSIHIYPDLEAPITSNTTLGTLTIQSEDKDLVTLNITTSSQINRTDIYYYFHYFFTNYTDILEKSLT